MTVRRPFHWLPILALTGFAACEPGVIRPDPSGLRSEASSAENAAGSIHFRSPGPSASRSASMAVEEVPPSEIRLSETVFNTDFVTAGLGRMRDAGTGTMPVSGISGTVNRAVLYWHGPTNTTNLDANANVMLNGTAVQGTNIGLADDNCWGYSNSMAYFADVTQIVQAQGNGNYRLTGFGSSQLSGAANTNGASLIVFFQDGSSANNRDVALFHGNDSNILSVYDPAGWDFTLRNVNYQDGSANIQVHVADGQIYDDGTLRVNGSTIAGPGAVFNGTTVPHGDGPDQAGSLWDIRNFDVSPLLNSGLNDIRVTLTGGSDCLSAVSILIDLPAGAAPTPDFAFQPATWSLSRTGSVSVYLLSDNDFDATQATADQARLIVDNAGAGAPVAQRAGQYMTALRDFDGDGDLDRLFVFLMSDLRAAGLSTSTASLTLADRTEPFVYDGRPIRFPTIVP